MFVTVHLKACEWVVWRYVKCSPNRVLGADPPAVRNDSDENYPEEKQQQKGQKRRVNQRKRDEAKYQS